MRRFCFSALALLLLTQSAFCGTWLESETTYLGDGWFRYRIGSRWCSYVRTVDLTSFGISPTPPWIDQSPMPANWTLTNSANSSVWTYDLESFGQQQVPYDVVFDVRSPYTSFKQATGTLLMSLTVFDLDSSFVNSGIFSVNIVGYWNFHTLVPCTPEAADGSPATVSDEITFPDIQITELLRNSDGIYGVTFDQGDHGTYVLQGSTNLSTWTGISYIYGQPGVTTWTTNFDLSTIASYFRLGYVGYGYIPLTNLPALGTPHTLVRAKPSPPVQVNSAPHVELLSQGRLNLRLKTEAGRRYTIAATHLGQKVWGTQVRATQKETTVGVPMSELPAWGFLEITPEPGTGSRTPPGQD